MGRLFVILSGSEVPGEATSAISQDGSSEIPRTARHDKGHAHGPMWIENALEKRGLQLSTFNFQLTTMP
jgi:hypothetical protein